MYSIEISCYLYSVDFEWELKQTYGQTDRTIRDGENIMAQDGGDNKVWTDTYA